MSVGSGSLPGCSQECDVFTFWLFCRSLSPHYSQAGAGARGLRGHLETVVLGSDTGEVVSPPLQSGPLGELKQRRPFTVDCTLRLPSALYEQ